MRTTCHGPLQVENLFANRFKKLAKKYLIPTLVTIRKLWKEEKMATANFVIAATTFNEIETNGSGGQHTSHPAKQKFLALNVLLS